MKESVRTDIFIYLTAAVLSLVLAIDGSLRASVVNPDGICYLQSATTLGIAGLHEAMHICGQAQWPFYSILIYAVTVVTKLSVIHAAFLLNGLLSLLTVFTFIYLIKILSGGKTELWCAILAIGCMHEFNSVREYIIRDHGFWAFYLLSLVLLIQYFRKPALVLALAWSSALTVATLFRVEGVLFLITLPWLAWLMPNARLRQFVQLNLLSLFALIAVMLYVLLNHHDVNYGRFAELLFQAKHGVQVVIQSFNDKSAKLAQAVLNGYSARDAKLIFGLMLAAWYVVSVITNLSLIYALLVGFAIHKKLLKLDAPAAKVFIAYLIMNVFITAPFLVEYMFLSKRYLIGLSLLLLAFVPFSLAALWKQRSHYPIVTVATAVFVVATALGGVIDFGYSKKYIRDAGLWLAENAPVDAEIYSNDFQVMFYSDHFGNSIFDKAGEYADLPAFTNKLQQYEYAAVHVDRHTDAKILQQLPPKPIQVFANRRGDAVLIFVRGNKEN